jgi:hypothetical protein
MTPAMIAHFQANAAGQPVPTPFPSAPQPQYAAPGYPPTPGVNIAPGSADYIPALPPGYVPPTPEQIAAWQASQAPVQTSPIPAVAQASAPEQPYGQPVPVALPAVAPAATELVQAFDDAAPPAPVEPKPTRKGRPPKGDTPRPLGGSGDARLDVIKGCILAGRTPVDCVAFLALLDNGGVQ